MKKDKNNYPKGWNAARVKRVADYYDNEVEKKAVRVDKVNKGPTLSFTDAPKRIIERRFAELTLGIVAGLRTKHLSIEDAEEDLFNMDVLSWVKSRCPLKQLPGTRMAGTW